MVDDEVPISVEGSFRMVENQMPVGSVVTFFFTLSNAKHGGKYCFNYWNKDKILVFVHRQMSTLL